MQSITPVTHAQLLATGQDKPSLKLEAFVRGSWVDFTSLYPPEGLVGWWPFDVGAGMVAYDKSLNENDGTLINMEEGDWVDGQIGKALDFDGVNEYVNCGINANSFAMGNGNHTFSAWIYPTAVPNPYNYVVAIGNNANGEQSGFGITDARKLFLSAYAAPIVITDYALPSLDEWYHIAMVYNGVTDIASFYVDGVWKEDKSILINTTVGKCFIGCHTGIAASHFTGLIDEARIYKRALTQAEITALAGLKGKSYLESVSLSLGGASMTPNPVGGTVSALLSNENGIFHPQHPTSAYLDWLQTGRKVRASVGAKYSAVNYLWQRVIGYIDEPRFEAGNQKVNISGADYMKLLQDTEFRSPDNYWGAYTTFSSYASNGLSGVELYNEDDAMDIAADKPNVTPWDDKHNATFVSLVEGGGGSVNVGKMVVTAGGADGNNYVTNPAAFTVEAGKQYKLRFMYKREVGTGNSGLRIILRQFIGGVWEMLPVTIRNLDSDSWAAGEFWFFAYADGAVKMELIVEESVVDDEYWIDVISVQRFTPYVERYYQIPEAAKGVHYVTLDSGAGAVPVWQGEEDQGWYYSPDAEPGPDPPAHPARILWFDINRVIPKGTNNLVVYYFTTTAAEKVVADLLYFAKVCDPATGLPYASKTAALDTIEAVPEYVDPNVDIDRVWFKVGSAYLDAIRMICERCNYRFYFKYDGTPVFRPAPSYSDALTDGGLNIWTSPTDLTNWEEGIAGTSTVNREATEKIEGDYSCRLDIDAGNSYVSIAQNNIPLTPLKRYKLTFWYMNSAEGKTCRFYFRDTGSNVYLKEDSTWNVGVYEIDLPNSLVWTPFEIEFCAHADYSTYRFYIKRLTATSSSIYFDKVSIWREEFTFTEQKHIASFSNYQDKGEIKNRIVIEGEKQAEPVGKEETMSPELRGEASDSDSITAYGERTLTIKNHLFQTQDSIDHVDTGMCAILLAERKDPKLYADIEIPYNPAPIELGDMVGWKERLSPTVEIIRRGIVRDIKIEKFSTTYKCEGK